MKEDYLGLVEHNTANKKQYLEKNFETLDSKYTDIFV